jgi:putative tryptophan/tyrosine transport system substrate-binding protein
MNRRDAVNALLALGSAVGPLGLRAQSAPSAQSKTLGILTLASPQDAERLWMPAFRAKLRALGWIEGQNLIIESAFADGKVELLATLAEELVRERVDVIWAYPDPPAIAAARATRTIPIVFFNTSWPVEQGLIESYGRPGRNVTGVTTYTGLEVSAKRLEFLKAVAPSATRLSWILGSPTEQTVDGAGFDIRPVLSQAARSLGYEVRYHFVQKSEDLDPLFADILASRAQALSVAGNQAIFAARERIAAFALSNRLPTAAAGYWLVESGGLLSYGATGGGFAAIPSSLEYVDRIFRGARPADLPVEQPSTYELVLNLKTAKTLGLQVPQSVRLRVGRVIE